MSVAELIESLPEAQRKHLSPESPVPMRMMAAKGMAPLPPREMVIVLCGLTLDGDEKLASAARGTLGTLPSKIMAPAIEADLPAAALGVLATALTHQEELLEGVVLNRLTPDAAVAKIAPLVSERLAEIIAGNQERCLRSEAIVGGIRQNPHLPRSSIDRIFDFLVRAGVFYAEMPEFADAMARLTPNEMRAAAAKIDLPEDILDLVEDSQDVDERADQIAEAMDAEKLEEVVRRIPVLQRIAALNVAERIALALKGNKEARAVLLRDSNRLVAASAIRSPRMTEPEIASAARSRSVAEEVIRIIANSKEMTRSYGVKHALVQNPKTPLPTAMRFLPLLRTSDVRSIAKSKNVPSGVSAQAKRLMQRKR